jgi:SAM-dependent methyltransferase
MSQQLIDVTELIENFSLSELAGAAEEYWKRLANNPRLLAKPYNLGDAEHILPQLGFLIQGLQLYPGMTLLDFGAGSCYASRILNQLGLRVISLDVANTALEIGRRLSEQYPPVGDVPEHIFSVFDGVHLDLPDNSVDRIFCLDALHHVPDQNTVLSEMGRVLKDGGIAGFAEPGPNHSKTSEAQLEMRTCQVIENDIVLSKIFESSRKAGFTELKISISTIHPPLVPLDEIDNYLANPGMFLRALQNRVTDFPIFFLYKGDPSIRDSRNAVGLSATITPRRRDLFVRRGEAVKFLVDVLNTSPKLWLASGPKSGCVNVGGMLRKQDGRDLATSKEYRFLLSHIDVEPNSAVNGVELNLDPLEPGEYSLEIDLVSENVSWFQSQSSETMVTVSITVR